MPNPKIRRALISVSDKTGLIPFARFLRKYKIEIISTGGTLKALKEARIPARPIDDVTGFPEIMDGRVKTLHPKVHGGLLYRRDLKSHAEQAKRHGIEAIDLVVVNLYPFEEVTRNPKVKTEDAIENIDIGGPSMLRSAAKNADAVTVVCDPMDYERVLSSMKANGGATSHDLRRELAVKVFARTAGYDQTIADFFAARMNKDSVELPAEIGTRYVKVRQLRYGENPHQRAALYIPKGKEIPRHFNQLHGKELSYNNILDIEAAVEVIREFNRPVACVIKHTNPCGIAADDNLAEAVRQAVDSDPLSAFGGIVGLNRSCGLETAKAIFEKLSFFEILIAPAFDKKALPFLKQRKNLRLIETGGLDREAVLDRRFLKSGGLLVQDEDVPLAQSEAAFKKELKFVTQRKLKGRDLDDLLFAFQCVKTVKSNAIVITQGSRTVGVGAGQMSRVDSVHIACRKAGDRTRGGILASDAFFPMPDSIDAAHEHGIRAIIQPGGSIRDADVIAACDRYGIAMAFTGKRHFKH